jgi:hypothetical protein
MQRLVEPLLKYYAGTVAKEMVQPVIEAAQLVKITPSAANIHIRDEIIDLALKFQRFSRSCDHIFYRLVCIVVEAQKNDPPADERDLGGWMGPKNLFLWGAGVRQRTLIAWLFGCFARPRSFSVTHWI